MDTAPIQHGAAYSPVTPECRLAGRNHHAVRHRAGPGDAGGGAYEPGAAAVAVTNLTPTVTAGGLAAKLLFSGLTPGLVGANQVEVQVPQKALAVDLDLMVCFPP